MKKSTPTPTDAILSATFFHAGCSVVKSFLSISPPGCFPSSLRKSRPGPQVGRAANEVTILPPVFSRAETAELSADNIAGSGFLIVENMVGSLVRSDVMTALLRVSEIFPSKMSRLQLTWIHSDQRTDPR